MALPGSDPAVRREAAMKRALVALAVAGAAALALNLVPHGDLPGRDARIEIDHSAIGSQPCQ
jgi:hypothetical protein